MLDILIQLPEGKDHVYLLSSYIPCAYQFSAGLTVVFH